MIPPSSPSSSTAKQSISVPTRPMSTTSAPPWSAPAITALAMAEKTGAYLARRRWHPPRSIRRTRGRYAARRPRRARRVDAAHVVRLEDLRVERHRVDPMAGRALPAVSVRPCCAESRARLSSASGITFTSASTGMKLVSPAQRGTTWRWTWSRTPAPAIRPRFQPRLKPCGLITAVSVVSAVVASCGLRASRRPQARRDRRCA